VTKSRRLMGRPQRGSHPTTPSYEQHRCASQQIRRAMSQLVNRVTLTLRQSLPVFLSKRTISEAAGMSQGRQRQTCSRRCSISAIASRADLAPSRSLASLARPLTPLAAITPGTTSARINLGPAARPLLFSAALRCARPVDVDAQGAVGFATCDQKRSRSAGDPGATAGSS
jgi:hypothetical protein